MTLAQAYAALPTRSDCIRRLEEILWRGVPSCSYCKSPRVSVLRGEDRYHCNSCRTSFSVTVGTVFHRTRLDLQRWFAAIVLLIESNGDISGRGLARSLGLSKDTGCSLRLKIVSAFHDPRHRHLFHTLHHDHERSEH